MTTTSDARKRMAETAEPDRVAELEAEVERLRRWKSEAMPVMDGLQNLGRALGVTLGQWITGPQALTRVAQLQSERDTARADRACPSCGERVDTYATQCHHCWSDLLSLDWDGAS